MEKSYIGGGGFCKKLQFKFKLNIYISIVNFTVQATDKNGPSSYEPRLPGWYSNSNSSRVHNTI